MCAEKIRTLYQLGTKKIAFTPKPDISNYRVASLIKKKMHHILTSDLKFKLIYYQAVVKEEAK